MRIRHIVGGAACMLAFAACSPGLTSTDPTISPPAVESPQPAAAPAWANPGAPDALKFRTADLVTGETIDGTTLMYQDVVLWFWASWCPVCAAESGALVEAAKEFPEGVKVIGIAGYSDVPASRGFVEEHGLQGFPHIYDEGGTIWKAFNITGQPTLVLVNHEGELRRYVGGYGKFDLIEKVAWLGESPASP